MAENSTIKKKGCFRPATCLVLALIGTAAFLCLLLVGLFIYGLTGSSEERAPRTGPGDFLRVFVAGPLGDAPPQGGQYIDPRDAPPTLTGMAHAIRSAARDEDVRGLYLVLNGAQAGWGLLRELREALLEFHASGKPMVAYAEGYSTRDYYLASVCHKIALAPGGVALINGMASHVTYYAGAFEKLGVKAEFEHVGDFKSAVEPFERTAPSEAASLAMNALLDSIWSRVLKEMASARGFGVPALQALIDRPSLAPESARERGLVDVVAFQDAVEACLSSALDKDWATQVALVERAETREQREGRFIDIEDYARAVSRRAGGRNIAVLFAEGEIVDGDQGQGLFGGPLISSGRYARLLAYVRESEDIAALVLRVNSPGGSGLASDSIWREVEQVRAAGKPVVVSMGDYAASGGYYVSCGTDWIVAQPTTLTGSIGVFGGKLNLQGTFAKLGLSEHTYKRGEMADLFDMNATFTPQSRQVFREFLEDFYLRFVERVAVGRKLDAQAVREIAKGRVWSGEQALERGLVDELGGLEQALAKAAELARLEDWGVVELPRPKGLIEVLLEAYRERGRRAEESNGGILGSGSMELFRHPVLRKAVEELVALERVLAGKGIAAYEPGVKAAR